MSENPHPTNRKPDPRAVRTRDRLGDALLQLLLTKPFDDIAVQEVLDRAQVSRSTFYEHYRDKNDLFLSDVDDFLQAMSTLLARHHNLSTRLAPVAELFGHVAASRELFAALIESGKMPEVRELGEAHFAKSIAEQLARSAQTNRRPTASFSPHAHALAGSLFSLLVWWMRQGMTTTPEQMDRLFHNMALGQIVFT